MLILPRTPHVEIYAVDGAPREALVFDGSGRAPKTGRPLILAFHGHGGTMRSAARSFDVSTEWPEATAIYPQGLPVPGIVDPEGRKPGWLRDGAGERDLKFVDAILDRAAKVTDPKRIYAMGHSNGGNFTYVLWARRRTKFAAYGPSGSPAGRLLRDLIPAPAFLTAGESDPLIPFAVQKRTLDAILILNGAADIEGKKQGFVTTYQGEGGIETGTYLHPGGHDYPPEAARATVAFFKRH